MNKIATLSGVILLVGLISYCSGCGNSQPKFNPKTDTTLAVYRQKHTNFWRFINEIYTTSRHLVATKDSSSSSGIWKYDTVSIKFWIENRNDTIRDANKKPLLDSATHQLKFNFVWYELKSSEIDSLQIVPLPK